MVGVPPIVPVSGLRVRPGGSPLAVRAGLRPSAAALVAKLTEAGVEHAVHSGVSVYFRDPDGARIELIADPLGEMYGEHVL